MKKRKVNLILLSFAFLVIVFLGLTLLNNNLNYHGDQRTADPTEKKGNDSSLLDSLNKNNEAVIDKIDTRESLVFALYGTDEQGDDVGRSDIIMVISYNPISRECLITSLPRDLRVNIPGYGLDKINHAYAYGGRSLIDQTIEELLGISLDFSVKVDFETFSKIIDDFSGVLVNAQKDFPYNDGSLAIRQGEQLLNGQEALFYVRFRSDEEGDFGRIARQQEVVISMLDQVSKLGLKKIDELINKYYNKGVETNASLIKLEEYVNLSSRDQVISFQKHRLETRSELIDGLWYELYTQEDLEAIKNLLLENENSE